MSSPSRDLANLRNALREALSPIARAALDRIVRAGAGSGGVFAVGGVVRDVLLARPTKDLDLVTDGDAISMLTEAAQGSRITAHHRFRTASITVDGTRIDVATARRETYPKPGSLPVVTLSAGIDADLRRRDFTINAMALRLDGEARLVDPCGGQSDLDARLVRVLHDGSFVDDPTRILRALRFSARLGFEVESQTRALIGSGLRHIATVSGARLRRELELALCEAHRSAVLGSMSDAGALTAIHPNLAWDANRTAALESPHRHLRSQPHAFALMSAGASPEAANAIATRLRLRRADAAAVAGLAAMRAVSGVLRRPDAKPSGVAVVLDRYPLASVAAFAATATDPIARQLALRYVEEWHDTRPMLNGNDLQILGVPAGPQIATALQLIRAARLDGWATDRDDERALALRFAKSIRDAARDSDIQQEIHSNGR